ncbi:MAG: enoyl-CoA hydratase/isomerase family protein [Bauldia litoralis]
MAGTVRFETQDAVATLTFDNPAKRNCFTPAMLGELEAAAREIAANPALAVVILQGSGDKAFCAGADFDALTEGGDITAAFGRMEAASSRAVAAMADIEIPIVASIRGACFGGGVQMSLLADIRIAADVARFCIPAVALGIVYPLEAVSKITQLCGPGAANRLLIGGERIDAAEAKAIGLIEEVVPAADLDNRVAAFAAHICSQSSAAARAYKAIIAGFAAGEKAETLAPIQDAAHAQGDIIARLEEVARTRAAKG